MLPKLFGSIGKLNYSKDSNSKASDQKDTLFDRNNLNYINLNNTVKTKISENLDYHQIENSVGLDRNVLGLWSIEGEYVQFPNKFVVTGKIEVWLKNFGKKLIQTVSHYIREAIRNYSGMY